MPIQMKLYLLFIVFSIFVINQNCELADDPDKYWIHFANLRLDCYSEEKYPQLIWFIFAKSRSIRANLTIEHVAEVLRRCGLSDYRNRTTNYEDYFAQLNRYFGVIDARSKAVDWRIKNELLSLYMFDRADMPPISRRNVEKFWQQIENIATPRNEPIRSERMLAMFDQEFVQPYLDMIRLECDRAKEIGKFDLLLREIKKVGAKARESTPSIRFFLRRLIGALQFANGGELFETKSSIDQTKFIFDYLAPFEWFHNTAQSSPILNDWNRNIDDPPFGAILEAVEYCSSGGWHGGCARKIKTAIDQRQTKFTKISSVWFCAILRANFGEYFSPQFLHIDFSAFRMQRNKTWRFTRQHLLQCVREANEKVKAGKINGNFPIELRFEHIFRLISLDIIDLISSNHVSSSSSSSSYVIAADDLNTYVRFLYRKMLLNTIGPLLIAPSPARASKYHGLQHLLKSLQFSSSFWIFYLIGPLLCTIHSLFSNLGKGFALNANDRGATNQQNSTRKCFLEVNTDEHPVIIWTIIVAITVVMAMLIAAVMVLIGRMAKLSLMKRMLLSANLKSQFTHQTTTTTTANTANE